MTMSKGAAAAVVWGVAIAIAGAVVVFLRAPVVPEPPLGGPPIAARAPTTLARPMARIELEPVVIVAARPPRPQPPGAPSASEARCGAWRPLVQGDVAQRVRSCE